MPNIRFDPTFLEEAVFLSVKALKEGNQPGLRALFYSQRNEIYERNLDQREAYFGRLNAEWFEKLGLQAFFEKILGDFPRLNQSAIMHFIKRVWTSKQEGADLHKEDAHATVLTCLQPSRSLQQPYLEAFLRHEWMHLDDMLNPSFKYSPHAPLGGENPAQEDCIRERFRILWDCTIDGRMMRRGYELPVPQPLRRSQWDKAFRIWDADRREKIFSQMQSDRAWTQGELIAIAGSRKSLI